MRVRFDTPNEHIVVWRRKLKVSDYSAKTSVRLPDALLEVDQAKTLPFATRGRQVDDPQLDYSTSPSSLVHTLIPNFLSEEVILLSQGGQRKHHGPPRQD
jgi:hypothetical protein